jgi:hypothetical protein
MLIMPVIAVKIYWQVLLWRQKFEFDKFGEIRANGFGDDENERANELTHKLCQTYDLPRMKIENQNNDDNDQVIPTPS